MVRSRSVKGPESARTDGARRATGVRADAAAGGAGALAPRQRWSASRKRDVVLRLLRGESLDAVSREVGVELYRLEAWKERALAGSRAWAEGSGWRTGGRGAGHGQASHWGAVDGGGTAAGARPCRGAPPPFADAEVATMSATTSATTGRRYGIQRVCQAWERSRSTHYARRARARRRERGEPARRGPTPAHSDEQLLAAVRADLARSPFQGEGPSEGARAAADPGRDPRRPDPSAARDARARAALAPPRAPGRSAAPRTGPSSPRRLTSCGGPTACGCSRWTTAGSGPSRRSTTGTRRASGGTCARSATGSPPSNPSRTAFASGTARWTPPSPAGWPCGWTMAANICRTTSSIRSGTGASVPASASSRNPKRTAVAERWNRTLKEQATYGRVFQRLDDGRAVVVDFVERYNQSWRPREAWLSDADRSARGVRATPGRVAQTCVQETGCGTLVVATAPLRF